MKISKRSVNDLIMITETVRTMISWGEGGSFNCIDDPDKIDYKAIKSAKRGIEFIERMLMQRE